MNTFYYSLSLLINPLFRFCIGTFCIFLYIIYDSLLVLWYVFKLISLCTFKIYNIKILPFVYFSILYNKRYKIALVVPRPVHPVDEEGNHS